MSAAIAKHYQDRWGVVPEVRSWKRGPIHELPADFAVLVFAPRRGRSMWTYATCGLSSASGPPPRELHLHAPHQSDAHVELLAVIAHHHATGAPLDAGHTVNFGRPWIEGSACDRGLVSLPYLDGPALEWHGSTRCLWLIPITASEVAFKIAHGLDALEERFERARFDYLDPSRKAVA